MALLRRHSRASRERASDSDTGQDAMTWEQRILQAAAEARARRIQTTVAIGTIGGGVLLIGFGPLAALFGMAVGSVLGYLFERSKDSPHSNRPA